MRTRFRLYIFVLAISLSLVACVSEPSVSTGDIVHPSVAPTGDIAQPSVAPIAASDDCPASEITRRNTQQAVNGILPGVSSEQELLDLWGEPTEIMSDYPDIDTGEKTYIYGAFLTTPDGISTNYNVSIKDNKVDTVSGVDFSVVSGIAQNEQLIEELQQYGCPDFVFLQSMGEHPVRGIYHGGYLVYLNEGLEIQFLGLPITTELPIGFTTYFSPMSQTEYVETHADESDVSQRIVSWQQAANWIIEPPVDDSYLDRPPSPSQR